MHSSCPEWTNEDLEELGLSFAQDAEERGVRLRLLGGIAVRLLCKDVIAQHPELDRLCGDIDLAGLSEDAPKIEKILIGHGFQPHKEFNFLNESARMLFSKGKLKVDVILDEFRMNHRWSIRERLLPDLNTLAPEDMLLTKLQVVDLTEKDLTDLLALGLKSPNDSLDLAYVAPVCLRSWGFTHTVLCSCEKVRACSEEILHKNSYQYITVFVRLVNEIKLAPKSLRWRLRAVFGESIRWYEPAEEPAI